VGIPPDRGERVGRITTASGLPEIEGGKRESIEHEKHRGKLEPGKKGKNPETGGRESIAAISQGGEWNSFSQRGWAPFIGKCFTKELLTRRELGGTGRSYVPSSPILIR